MEKVVCISKKKYNEALIKIRQNRISEGIEILDEALKYYSKDVDLLNLMGICKYVKCDFNKANFYFNKSLNLNDRDNKAKYYLEVLNLEKLTLAYNEGINFIRLKKEKQAIRKFENIIKEQKMITEPYLILGLLYLKQNQIRKANKYFVKANKIDRSDFKAIEYLNHTRDLNKHKQKRYKIILFGMTIIFIGSLGRVLINHKEQINKLKIENKKEIEKYNKKNLERHEEEKNIELLEKSEETVFKDGIELFRKKEYEEALKKFESVKKYGMDAIYIIEASYYEAITLEKLKRYTKAIKSYGDYIKKYKNKNYYDDAIYNCGLLLYKLDKKEEARKVLEKLKSIPQSIYFNTKVKYILGEQ